MTMRSLACLAALTVLAAIAGCANEPTRIQPGATAADTLQRLGAPTGRYPLNNGGERLQYSRMPAGFEVTDIDVDAAGKVVRAGAHEARDDIKVNQWRAMSAFYGRPW
jgi:phosphoribosylcarboxyaminoimidazole (NCAIR) mutase